MTKILISVASATDYHVPNIAKWLEANDYYLIKGNNRIPATLVDPDLHFLNVRSSSTGKKNIGTLNYYRGNWVFVKADLTHTKHDMSTLGNVL